MVRLGCKRDFVLVAAADGLSMFSLSSVEAGLWGGIGDGGGKKLEISFRGIFSFEGPKGGFFSAMVFRGCFNLVFLSTAN